MSVRNVQICNHTYSSRYRYYLDLLEVCVSDDVGLGDVIDNNCPDQSVWQHSKTLEVKIQ